LSCGAEEACKTAKLQCGPGACSATCAAGADPPGLDRCPDSCRCQPCAPR
jgi:hypothetical protein